MRTNKWYWIHYVLILFIGASILFCLTYKINIGVLILLILMILIGLSEPEEYLPEESQTTLDIFQVKKLKMKQ